MQAKRLNIQVKRLRRNMSTKFRLMVVQWMLLTLFSVSSISLADSSASVKKYYVNDIKEAMYKHITNHVDEDGIFHLKDEKTNEILELEFVKIHNPVRQINDHIYFACTDFRVHKEPQKLYDLDFWMDIETGELRIYQTKIHKEPRKSLIYGWYKQPRYTFVNDKVIPLY